MRRLLPALVLLFALPALAQGPGDSVVAVVGGEPITLDDVDGTGSAQLTLLKDQLHWARVAAVENLISRRILEVEAKAQGLSLSSFIEQEVSSKIAAPTDADVAAFWQQNPSAAPPERRAELTEGVMGLLKRERSEPIRNALIARLRTKHAPDLKLQLPSARSDMNVDGRPAKGPKSAAVTVVAFTDYQCGGCASLVQDLEGLKGNFREHLRVVHVDCPSESHERAVPAAIAARCAGRFGKYWEFHDSSFTDVSDLTDERLEGIASALGLDADGFADCRADPSVAAEVAADRAIGHELGVTGTPHLFVNGLSLRGGLDAQQLGQIIAMELDRLGVKAPGS